MATGVPEFRRALGAFGDRLDGDVAKLTSALSRFDRGEAMRYVTDAYPELVTPYLAAAGDLTAVWYEAQPAAPGAPEFFAEPATLPDVEQLAVNGRWALTQPNPATALQGSGRRAMMTSHRSTVVDNAAREGVRWVRHARAGACGFCRLLATRGAVYRTKARALKSHDHCTCLAVPDRDGSYEPPGYVQQWEDDYEAVSRDGDGRLLTPGRIVDRMEARARARGEIIGVDPAPKPLSARKPVDLDAGQPAPAASASGSGTAPPPRPPRTANAAAGDGEWDDAEHHRRQDRLGIDTQGERLTRHEIEFVERFHASGEQLEWIPRDRRHFTPTNDFVWASNQRIEVELKSTKARYETIHGRIVDAASRAAKAGVVKENFVIDIGDQPLTDELRGQLADFNKGRRKYRLAGLWVMSQGQLIAIVLTE